MNEGLVFCFIQATQSKVVHHETITQTHAAYAVLEEYIISFVFPVLCIVKVHFAVALGLMIQNFGLCRAEVRLNCGTAIVLLFGTGGVKK
jgi:hypothetical protein